MLIFRDEGSRREKGGPYILTNGQTCSTKTEECLYLEMEGVEGKKEVHIFCRQLTLALARAFGTHG
jgi:hypothetical protein